MGASDPPQPPPMPAKGPNHPPSLLKMSSKVSPFIKKLQNGPKGYSFEPQVRPQHIDSLAPPTGLYFFYGTLMDPSLFSEILSLPEKPMMRPAKLVGLLLKALGPVSSFGGWTDRRSSQRHERLAEYETSAYRPAACRIRFLDGKEPREESGTTFKYIGNPIDLSEGNFDLAIWLRRMRRV